MSATPGFLMHDLSNPTQKSILESRSVFNYSWILRTHRGNARFGVDKAHFIHISSNTFESAALPAAEPEQLLVTEISAPHRLATDKLQLLLVYIHNGLLEKTTRLSSNVFLI